MEFQIEIADPCLGRDQLDAATSRLYRELRELPIEGIERARGGGRPAGARGDPLEIATLLVMVADSAALATVMRTLRGWLASAPGRSARLRLGDDELEVDGLSSAEQERLIDEWLERQRGR